MPGLKRHMPDVRFAGNKVTPDEVDMRVRYAYINPSIGTATIGTIAAGTVAAAWTLVNTVCDYPRNLLFTVVGPSGGAGGTCVINGKNQFGVGVTETITIASANAGGTAAGTSIFDQVTSGTYYPNGVDNTSTATLGYTKGTGALATWPCYFGLPVKIGSTSDVKRITTLYNGVTGAINGGTIAAYVNTANHWFTPAVVGTATTTYVVDVLSTYNSENDNNVA
jgi:hypothetical protein